MESVTHIVGPLKESHTHTVIFLHGRDSIASEFAAEFFESRVSDDRTLPEIFPTVKWVFPASKLRNSTRFQSEMSQWFDIWSVEEPSEKKEIQIEGLRESIGEILGIIRREATIIPPERIILGGISQGCATAIHALLCSGIRFGGFIGFCSWLPFQDDIAAITTKFPKSDRLQHIRSVFDNASNESKISQYILDLSGGSALETPIFLSHSQDDDVVHVRNGRDLYKTLESLDLAVTWKEYEDGGHWVNEPQGIDDMVAFLQDKI